MARARLVLVVAASLLAGVLLLGFLALAVATRTELGRDTVRRWVMELAGRGIKGRIYLGRLGGSFLGDLSIDSLEIRDFLDSVFVASGPVSLRFDPRDLLERRIRLTQLNVERLRVHLDQDSTGQFNFQRIFPPGTSGPPREAGRRWGDFIAVDSAVLDGFELRLSTAWRLPDTLPRTLRDSVLAAARAEPGKDIQPAGSWLAEIRYWRNGRLVLGRSRLDGSSAEGRRFEVLHLDVDESDPPFALRNVRGVFRLRNDSLLTDVPHFELPGSRGRLRGSVTWREGPVRVALAVEADTLSLADVAWVYPTLPRDGGGHLKLDIRSGSDPTIVEYAINDMDVSTTGSRLRGSITFGVGAPLLIVKDVDLVAQPLDFELIAAFNGGPLPLPWRGTIAGTLRASGGPLDRFRVDRAEIVFRDGNVPGALAVGRAWGEMDLSQPALVAFRGLHVEVDQLDLRTLQALSPVFPKLNGIVSGKATLDSTWLDVRFRDADVVHRDGSGPETRALGGGRVTFSDTATIYDVALEFAPFSFTTFARAYSEAKIPLAGEYRGPLRLEGSVSDMVVSTELHGPAGLLAYDGRVDADSAGGYALRGSLRFAALDVASLAAPSARRRSDLNGRASLEISGDSLANLLGSLTLELARSYVDSVRLDTARVVLRAGAGRLLVDTALVESAIGTLGARGALGLAAGIADTLHLAVRMDSLGGWRRLLKALPAGEEADTLRGRAELAARAIGSVRHLDLVAGMRGSDWKVGPLEARLVRADLTVAGIGSAAPSGSAELGADSLQLAGVSFANAGLSARMSSSAEGDFSVLLTSSNGPVWEAAGGVLRSGDTTRVSLRRLGFNVGDHSVALQRPVVLTVHPNFVALDTMRLLGRAERILVAGFFPRDDSLAGVLQVDSLHLEDLSRLLQMRSVLSGMLNARIDIGGTRKRQLAIVSASVLGASLGAVTVASIAGSGTFDGERLTGRVAVVQRGVQVLDIAADLPLALPFSLRNDTLRIQVRSGDVGLDLLESFTTKIRNARGRFTMNLDLAGPARGPELLGRVEIVDGAATLTDLGITLQRVNVALVARGDTLHVARASLASGSREGNFLRFSGWLAHPLAPERMALNLVLDARDFHAIGRRQTANLYVSARELALRGPFKSARASGVLTVEEGSIRMPEITGKQLFTVEDPSVLGTDTLTLARLNLLPRPPAPFLAGLSAQNVEIVMGNDVWLESDEAKIKLTGSVNVTVSPGGERHSGPELALEGRLVTERGTYRLNLAGVVQRTFVIEGGELRFLGEPGFNPLLDISALYTVRQISATYGGRNDVRIRARLLGTLERPTLVLESADTLSNLSPSDMISYLLTNRPSFGISADIGQNAELASAILFGTFSSWVSSWWSGGPFDYVQILTAADRFRLPSQSQQRSFDLFEGAQLGVGRQLNDRTFIALTAGLCQFQQVLRLGSTRQLDPLGIAASIGIKLEHQLGKGYGVALSLEPPLNALLCSQVVDPGFTAALRQYSFDFFRVWRY
jgi:translocation and assembly module TamB